MRKLALVLGLGLVASIAAAAPATAHTFKCNEVVTGGSFKDVTVPRDGSCTLTDSTVTGKVKVKRGAFFQATGTDIGRGVHADDALTVFIDTGSTVGRSVETDDTAQVFVFNATVGRDIEIDDASEVVQICGTTVTKGDVEITDSGFDILVGDPQAKECAGNTVSDGDVEINHNRAEVEFVVRGNTIAGDLDVNRNRGPVEKFVEDNTGGEELECHGNDSPFTASGNNGWEDKEGQCREVLTCDSPQDGVTTDDVVVPVDAVCTLTNSTVTGNVFVSRGGFFQATGTDIGGGVKARDALTLFIDTGSTVGRGVDSDGTAQVFVFNATVGDIEVEHSSEVVQVCGTQVRHDVEIERSAFDILVGDPQAKDCAGNTVGDDVEVERNDAQVELVVRGNTIGDDLEVSHNSGPADKFVEDNTGNGRLECFGNEDPFAAARNTFPTIKGQCEVPEV
jgi:hypothetical protein